MGQALSVTVAIATLDRPALLSRCLDAVLAGSVLPGEIVVVDQSSDDRTRSAITRHRAPAAPIVYERQARRGLSASRNAALARASGSVVAMTDDDCVPGPGWVGAIAGALAASPELAAITGRVLPLGPERPGLYAVSSRTSGARADFRGKTLPWIIGTGGNVALRQTWIERVGPYDERLGAGSPGRSAEEMDLFYRLLRAGATVRYEPAAVVYHERQSRDRRISSRFGYGYGMGAFCGIWLRRRHGYAGYLLARCGVDSMRAVLRAIRHRDRTEIVGRLLYVRGLGLGAVYGLGLERGSEPGARGGVMTRATLDRVPGSDRPSAAS